MNIEGVEGRLITFKKTATRLGVAAVVVVAGYAFVDSGARSVDAAGPVPTATPTRLPTPTLSPTPAGPTADEIQREIERVVQGRLNAKATSTAMAEANKEKTPVPPTPVIVRVETRDNVFDWGDAFMGAMVLGFLGTVAVAGTAATAVYANRARIAQLWRDHVRIRFH